MRGWIALLFAGAAGCVTETGNPELQISFEGRSSAPEVALDTTLRAHLPVQVDAAWINIGGVRLVQSEGCDTASEAEYNLPGPFTVNLRAAPQIAVGRVSGTDYCRVRVDVDRVDTPPAGAPSVLEDHALFVAGSIADGTPFEILSRYQGALDLQSKGAAFAIGDSNEALVVAFDVGLWLQDLHMETAEESGGVLRIDDDNNRDLLEEFEEQVESAVELYGDSDEDGRVDDDDDLIAD